MAERKGVLVRLRPDMYDALRRWAADEFRSVNGQIEYLLHVSLLKAGRHHGPSPPARAPDAMPDRDAGTS